MRVLRLAQSWTTMRVLLSIILSSLGALANLTFVLAIVVYIFAVIGMQLFGRDYTPENFYPDPVPRWNFKDFFHSFMMIFRILCGEWAEPLWDCMRAERKYVKIPISIFNSTRLINLDIIFLLLCVSVCVCRRARKFVSPSSCRHWSWATFSSSISSWPCYSTASAARNSNHEKR